jgi:hypothetical protein
MWTNKASSCKLHRFLCVETLLTGEIKWLLVFVLAVTADGATPFMGWVVAAAAAVAAAMAGVWVWQVETGSAVPETYSAQLGMSSSVESHQLSQRWSVAWHLGRIQEQPLCQQDWQE